MEGEPPKHEERWKTTPAKLSSAAVFHLCRQIAATIAKHAPASCNEVQMQRVSSVPRHLPVTLGKLPRLWAVCARCKITATALFAWGIGAKHSRDPRPLLRVAASFLHES